MKLKNISSVFNMGDTSFRRKTLLQDYKELLPLLIEHKMQYPVWEKDNKSQEVFFRTVLEKTEFFDEETNFADLAKRGRTLTNALIKPGLINDKREISEVALHWVNNKTKEPDNLEKLMNLSLDNLIFLRQWFKLRVYEPNGEEYFYPFRVALRFLRKYKDMQEYHLLVILHLLSPSLDNEKIYSIIENYDEVRSENISFEKYLDENLKQNNEEEEENLMKAIDLFSSEVIDIDKFNELFKNGKTKQEVYYKFFEAIEKFNQDKVIDNLKILVDISKEPAIKKAFGFNKIPFDIPKTNNFTVEEFLKKNKNNNLLSENRVDFYLQFAQSKKVDLVREYSDMTKRTFGLSGFISFNNGLVNLTQPWIVENLFKVIGNNLSLAGVQAIKEYEGNINSSFYSDISLTQILNLSTSQIKGIEDSIKEEFGVSDVSTLEIRLEQEQEAKFRKVIENEFPKEKVIKLLGLFSERSNKNDRKIKELVTDSATVPTIFEYIIAIAWFYISDLEYSLRRSVNLSLDGNYKPLTHAAGGDGDIVMDFPNYKLMLEATLMDTNSQKRGELEPVIRHTANLAIRSQKEVLTIFVADKVDSNVTNIFKGASYIELVSTENGYRDKSVDGVDIFALTINEIAKAIQGNVKQTHIVDIIKESYMKEPIRVKTGWREELVEKIFV
ncbi:AlwI family type II restriction endonuclease [Clostridium perfringens]|uniref:AlwI family type II restriction endonuclease n=1 Tax=Clostridium perfringens TaxID=1502 RepID=UPI00103BEFFA|nr:AlwI family type II restriction endonuclease [Clostridium perfringens]MBO3323091.1 AlwI family type II restriction endonuclease [Clostridium perfringens]MBO3332255.1 AlwI family type II restriction endonuclease [Clostridium perfringens]MCR1964821.1 AlwI family type II restriction endonuclease [Clostridium perfringens]MDM0506254.1 AlwI family type II restriction endonuclease [Clostridium perfringens]MDM0615422.1 AlwI family type II restriction endonuclease [Clostridium perfringens]